MTSHRPQKTETHASYGHPGRVGRRPAGYGRSWLLILFIVSVVTGHGQLSVGKDDTINAGVPVTLTATYGLTGIGIPSREGSEDWVTETPLPIGFDFSFFNQTRSVFYVGANGWISFSPNLNAKGIREPVAVPSSVYFSPKSSIMGPFQDLYPMTEGSPYIFYRTVGEAPARKLVVMWCDCPMYLCTDQRVTFQIILNEEDNSIENHIYSKPACPDNYGNKATLGIQDEAGLKGYSVPGRNATSWTAEREAWKYIPAPAAPDSFSVVSIPYDPEPVSPGNKISYRWYEGNTLISEQQSLVVAPSRTTTYRAVCTICSGEQFTDELTVYVIPFIPNAFTPNGDGLNDQFRITGLPPENITRYNIQIFNRWGEVVFASTDIREGWDGTSRGQACPEGNYVWVIFYEDDNKTTTSNKGTITLVR